MKTYKNDSASCLYQTHRSIQTGWVRGKKYRNEINSVDDHRVWLCIHVTFSSIGKVFGLPADRFVPSEFEVLLAVFLLLVMAPLLQGLFLTCPIHLQWLRVSHSMIVFVCCGLTSLINN